MVTVEYHDPSGVFALVQPNLLARLPLRNLKWKSPTRPLRNIETLHVDFVPVKDGTVTAAPAPIRRNSVRSAPRSSGDSIWPTKPETLPRSISQPLGNAGTRRERRHQIPGLRETPFLKLYILRCDDKEAYRAEHRQLLREWVKQISPKSTQSTSALSKHDNHDAYEWMIIHVVIPDTPAANEPRWTSAKKDPDELAERSKSKTKWTSKGTSTVFDKIRADFHPPSKTDLERVAQIRLPKSIVPVTLLPKVPVPSQLSETAQEQENAWQDLVGKFKTLILQSFDLRVGQYEEDVRAKESQRALPGWNFCTFFVLKEGLSKVFESVGLMEDALAIYDELAAGLDAMSSDISALLGDLAPLRQEISDLAKSGSDPKDADPRSRLSDLLYAPLNINLRDYRNLIVSSTISLFDFHIYIFARQRLLIYRLGSFEPQDGTLDDLQTPMSAVADISEKIKTDDQLARVAEVCRRAIAFISANTRTFTNGVGIDSAQSACNYANVVQTVAASWAFNTAEKILAETSVSLTYAPSSATPTARDGNFSFSQGANAFPTRKSSLPAPQTRSPKTGSITVYEKKKDIPADDESATTAAPGSGLAELAAQRGELCLLQRRFLEMLALQRGWKTGWAAIDLIVAQSGQNGALIDTEDEPVAGNGDLPGVLNEELVYSFKSESSFHDTYAELTDIAVKHLLLGQRLSVVESLLGDLALLKYQKGDMTGAVQILQKLVAKFNTAGWSSIKSAMIWVYARCLKVLKRRDEYVRTSLSLLTQNLAGSQTRQHRQDGAIPSVRVDLNELAEYSKEFAMPFRTPLEELFSQVTVDAAISHQEWRDGFTLGLSISSQLDNNVNVDAIKVKLVSTNESGHAIWLQSTSSQFISHGFNSITVSSSSTAFGLYAVQQITFEAGRLQFAKSFEPKTQTPTLSLTARTTSQSKPGVSGPVVMVYPRARSLSLAINLCPDVHIDKQRSLYVEIDAGDMDTGDLTLRFKPATAGLRLHTADAKILDDESSPLGRDSSGALKLAVKAETMVTLSIPYSLEAAQTELHVKVEALARRDGHEFPFVFEEEVSTSLLLDVDVNDFFKEDCLFSRFSVRTTSEDPLLLYGINIDDSHDYSIKPLGNITNIPVFDKQPAWLACCIEQVSGGLDDHQDKSSALKLQIKYSSILDAVVDSITANFDKAILASTFARYRRFFLPTLQTLLRELIDGQTLEQAVILHEYSTPTYSAMGWQSYLMALPHKDRAALDMWLKEWHSCREPQIFELDEFEEARKLTLTLPVDIPSIDLVTTVSLRLDELHAAAPRLPPIATVGQPTAATLCITHTRKWDAVKGDGVDAENPESSVAFTFTILDSTDWLMAGPSTATFSASAGETMSFPLLLIPLVPGVVLLPTVDVTLATRLSQTQSPTPSQTPFPATPSSTASTAATVVAGRGTEPGSGSRYTCEVHYESGAETVLVLRPHGDADYIVLDAASTMASSSMTTIPSAQHASPPPLTAMGQRHVSMGKYGSVDGWAGETAGLGKRKDG